MKSFDKTLIAASLSIALVFPAQAMAAPVVTTQGDTIAGYSQTEVDQLASDLEKLFTRYVTLDTNTGVYVVQKEAILLDGLTLHTAEFESIAKSMNSMGAPAVGSSSDIRSDKNMASTMSANSYARCVLVGALGVSVTATPGLVQAAATAIRAWNWGLAAKTVARIIGPIALRSVGGPWGLAAALAASAATCAFNNSNGPTGVRSSAHLAI